MSSRTGSGWGLGRVGDGWGSHWGCFRVKSGRVGLGSGSSRGRVGVVLGSPPRQVSWGRVGVRVGDRSGSGWGRLLVKSDGVESRSGSSRGRVWVVLGSDPFLKQFRPPRWWQELTTNPQTMVWEKKENLPTWNIARMLQAGIECGWSHPCRPGPRPVPDSTQTPFRPHLTSHGVDPDPAPTRPRLDPDPDSNRPGLKRSRPQYDPDPFPTRP